MGRLADPSWVPSARRPFHPTSSSGIGCGRAVAISSILRDSCSRLSSQSLRPRGYRQALAKQPSPGLAATCRWNRKGISKTIFGVVNTYRMSTSAKLVLTALPQYR